MLCSQSKRPRGTCGPIRHLIRVGLSGVPDCSLHLADDKNINFSIAGSGQVYAYIQEAGVSK
jgi:hypothetical protein